ncbi:MAG: MBL fold metallo-hydrolase, partial [Lachnospiraceae bacterium]|nr:MBL fold metallo-hydrolase [Lachnospiraceae bacterium]
KDIDIIEPTYTMEDVENTIRCFVPCSYGKEIEVCEGVRIRFTDIGHLLGSSSIEVWLQEKNVEKKLVFSGDIGNKNQPLIKDPQYTEEADYVVMESTYGDRLHPGERPDYVKELAAILDRTFARGGNVVIPSFAIGRTQEVLYFIRLIKRGQMVTSKPDFKVFVDSPLAVEATEIFERNQYDCYDDEALELIRKHINPITFPGLNLSITTEESRAINEDPEPKVIISAAGMCDAGRIRHHLKHNLWRPESTVMFVGYQAQGTLGRALFEGAEEVKLFGEPISVRAAITSLPGLSGHADRDGLAEWLSNFEEKPQKVFMVHGDDMSCMAFTEYVNREMKIPAYAPFSGTVVDLATGEIIEEAAPEKRKPRVTAISDAFARLLAAGQRLLAVIQKNKDHANKDLAKFTSQINSLSDKWDPDSDPIIEKPRKGKRKR